MFLILQQGHHPHHGASCRHLLVMIYGISRIALLQLRPVGVGQRLEA